MGIVHSPRHATGARCPEGPVGPHIATFEQYLTARGYAAATLGRYLAHAAHFDRWAEGRRLRLNSIGEATVADFLERHRPCCLCSGLSGRQKIEHRAALAHLLVTLRAQGVVSPPKSSKTAVDVELARYDEYMKTARGLAPRTREMALRIVGRLLRGRFGHRSVHIAALKPDQVRQFFAEQAQLYSKPAHAGVVVSALHGYFRNRASLGDSVHGLIGAVSYPANWALSSLPKTLTDSEVRRLVESLQQPGRSMLRAAAIVRCALDLGLRSCEVARLALDDIDWSGGTITLRRTKGLREDVLPLPETTGKAIAAYLQHERPSTSNRAVFVRNVAPRHEPVGADLVRKTIRQAYGRAGLPYTRAHLLRHTMANRLLGAGSSLKEVADLLRHRSLNTTMIYAKLDSRKLVDVALPWPGSTS